MLSALVWAACADGARGQPAEEEDLRIPRLLAHLRLGEPLKAARRIYPGDAPWPHRDDGRAGIRRYRVDRDAAKNLPESVEVMWLGFRNGRLAEVQLIYDEDYSAQRPAPDVAAQLALRFGQPRRSGSRFWWTDGRTVLRVMAWELPGEGGAVELRTSLQVMNAALLRRRE